MSPEIKFQIVEPVYAPENNCETGVLDCKRNIGYAAAPHSLSFLSPALLIKAAPLPIIIGLVGKSGAAGSSENPVHTLYLS